MEDTGRPLFFEGTEQPQLNLTNINIGVSSSQKTGSLLLSLQWNPPIHKPTSLLMIHSFWSALLSLAYKDEWTSNGDKTNNKKNRQKQFGGKRM